MDNSSNIFSTNIRVNDINAMDIDAIWPHNIEICICRIPIRKRDGYSLDKLNAFSKKLKSHMVQNGIVFLICYAPMEDKSRPFEVGRTMSQNGFNHVDNIVIQKSWFPGKRSEVNLVNSHEYVLYFCNGDIWNLDRLPIREYLKIEEDISCPGNTWLIRTGSLDDSYPVDLAELLIRMTDCLPGSMIFDPFMGSSASLRAAIELGHSFHGFERDSRRMKRYRKIIDSFNKIKQR